MPVIRYIAAVKDIKLIDPNRASSQPAQKRCEPRNKSAYQVKNPDRRSSQTGGTTSNVAAAWFPVIKPAKKPTVIAAIRASVNLPVQPSRNIQGAPQNRAMRITQNRDAGTRELKRSASQPPTSNPHAVPS